MPTSSVSQQSPSRLDLLRVPYLGSILLWKHSRTVAQTVVFAMVMAIIIDGLLGSPLAAKNVATVSAWVHYRGFVVLALLLFGNLFCAACPFVLPRRFAKWLGKPTGRWPKPLRNKWMAITALIAIIFLYELFDLWASPWWTAWLAIAYFAAAFVLEALFTGSSFCKYVCPLGTFNFLYSTASPSQITAQNFQTCRDCVGHECINGSSTQQGCQLELYVPTLATNMDCTLCLDCAKACPHDNVALVTRPYGSELVHQTWPHRLDLALLAILAAFMALINAFAMTPPAYRLEIKMASLSVYRERGHRSGHHLCGWRIARAACPDLHSGLAFTAVHRRTHQIESAHHALRLRICAPGLRHLDRALSLPLHDRRNDAGACGPDILWRDAWLADTG